MGKHLEGASVAIVSGALIGGVILGAYGGKGMASLVFGAATGAVAGGIAGGISLIKTNKSDLTCLKTAIALPIAASLTLAASLYIAESIDSPKKSPPLDASDHSWYILACTMLWLLNFLSAIAGTIGAQFVVNCRRESNLALLDDDQLKLS